MKSLKCSQCGLVNFADAFVCKRCNYQFRNYPQTANQTNDTFYEPAANTFNHSNSFQKPSGADTSASVRKMFFGALWAGGGTIATVLSYGSASGGGKYFVFWGAILFGVIDFLIGFSGWVSNKD